MSRVPPAGVVRAATAVRAGLQSLTRRMVPPEVALLELATGFTATHSVYAVATLGIADAMAGGPRTADGVAAEVGSSPDATYRLLRAAATFDIVRQQRDGRFRLTPMGRRLRSDAPDSMLPVVLMLGDPAYQGVWGRLARAVETGTPVAEESLGEPMWDYLDHHPDFAATFDDAMTRLTALDWPAVRAAYDVTGFSTIVDLGGGHGELLVLMLREAPTAKGVLLEREALVGPAEEHLRAAGVLDRCRIDAGSFFQTAPTDGDLYVLRRVVHDFDDDDATTILATVRRHMPRGSTLLLMECVVPPGNAPHLGKTLDLDMLAFVGGRERTERQFASLLERAGFRMTRVIPTISPVSLVEALPGAVP